MSNGILDSDQSRALDELLGSLAEEMLAKGHLKKSEKAEPEQHDLTESNMDRSNEKTRQHISKRTDNRLQEKNDILAGPETVTSAQLQQNNQELWARVQTALAGLGGGGLGDADVLDLIKRNPSYNFFTDSDYQFIANKLQTNFVHRQGDSMYGTLHLNRFSNTAGSIDLGTDNISLMEIDGPEEGHGDINFFRQQEGYNDSTSVAFRLHGSSFNHWLSFRAGQYSDTKEGDVLAINANGNIKLTPRLQTDNYSKFVNHDLTMRFEGTNSKIEMYEGHIASDIIRSYDSSLRLFKDYGSLKAKFDGSLTEFWNDQIRIHGALYVDDSGTIGNDLTVGGDLNVSGDVTFEGDLSVQGTLSVDSNATFGAAVSVADSLTVGTSLTAGPATVDSLNTEEIHVSRATTAQSDPFFTFYEENGTHTLGVGWDLALLGKAENDVDRMALVTSENKILRIGYRNQSGFYEYPISIGTGDVTSTEAQRQRSTKIKYLAEPAASHDAVPLGYLTNTYTSRLQPSQIGDSAQRSVVQSGFSTPIDSTDSSGGVGTFFINTSGLVPRLQFWKDSQWQDLRSKFDSGEVLSIVNSLRYTTANHDSDTLAQVDSAYVQARVSFPADTIIDSNDVVGIVDSAYVQTRIDASQLDFSGVPTSDPLTAGLVWRDSDNGNVLKVSVG